MRNIKDLKSTEQIFVSTDKEAKKIKKLVETEWTSNKAPFYFTQTGDCKTISPFCGGHLTTVPASDFLPKKNKVNKRLKALEAKVDEFLAKECVVSEAEHVKEQPTEIDWSKPGQLVSAQGGLLIVMTTGTSNDENGFKGIVLADYRDTKLQNRGAINTVWDKESFSLHTQPITLCNE